MIYLASVPRCRSTYLLRSICGLPQAGHTPPDVQDRFGIVKTHLQPKCDARIDWHEGDSAIFVFGDVPCAVLSTIRYRRDAQHFGNCGRPWDPTVDLMETDYLGYTPLFVAWADLCPFPVLCVRGETLYVPAVRRIVEGWLNRKIEWLPWKARRTVPTPEETAQIEETYAELTHRVNNAHPVFFA